jgi:hypothetical protein
VFELAVVAVILAVARADRSWVSLGLAWRPLCWVGAISYGLYLWHWPVLVFLSEGRTRLDGWQLFTLRAVVTTGCALLSYVLLEQPIRHGRWFRGRAGLVVAPLAILLTLGVIIGGTRDAAPPPAFLVANPNEVQSLESSPPSPDGAPPEVSPSTLPPTADRDVGRVLLIGDSVAMSAAQFGLLDYAQANGVDFAAETRPGCGLIAGLAAPSLGKDPVDWAAACNDSLVDFQQGIAARKGAQTVVWMSTWETSSRWYDGRYYEFGTPEADELTLRLIDEARIRVLAGTDAMLVLALQPPHASFSDQGPADPENVARMVHLNELLAQYAADHPTDTRTLDLASLVCPGGPPCPETVDGIRLRPRDGGHYESDGAVWLAPRFFSELLVAAS